MTWVPETCTLPSSERPLRVAEFDGVIASSVRPAVRQGRAWLQLYVAGGDELVPTVRELIARETACCSFFTFDLRPTEGGMELDVWVPESYVAVLDALEQRAEAVRTGSGPVS